MAKQGTTTRSSGIGHFLTVRANGARRSAKVKFGSVTISGTKPAAATVATNVKRSTDALERVTKTLSKPGVVIRPKKDVPQFSAEGERGVFIRRLNGRVERGRMLDGTFQVID
jgi:hypothetical protein